MIGPNDRIAMCGLEPEEVAAIWTMIIEDIQEARDHGEVKHADELVVVLQHFLDHHPEAAVGMEVDSRSSQ